MYTNAECRINDLEKKTKKIFLYANDYKLKLMLKDSKTIITVSLIFTIMTNKDSTQDRKNGKFQKIWEKDDP